MIRNLLSQTPDKALELNIARIEHHLKLIEQQQESCDQYSDYKARLAERQLQLQHQLQQLLERRDAEY